MEYLRGEHMSLFPLVFDVVFCLGVLYHTTDPIGMLKHIHKSMKPGATLIVDCQGIPGKTTNNTKHKKKAYRLNQTKNKGEEHVALFPQKRYANMKGKGIIKNASHFNELLMSLSQECIFYQPSTRLRTG